MAADQAGGGQAIEAGGWGGGALTPALLVYLAVGGIQGGGLSSPLTAASQLGSSFPYVPNGRRERSSVVLDPVELFPEVPNIYSFPSVHADMMFDEARVGAYRNAINATVKEGDVVADLGAGTGLLTFLCLQAGARKVHAIERTDVIQWAKEIAARNGFLERIEFHHSDARETDLGEKVDVIVSELMGHVAFEEGMAETISLAKQRFLAPGGRAIPQTVTLKAALVNETDLYRNYIDIWNRFKGIDFSVVRKKAVRGTYILDIDADCINSESLVVRTDDFTTGPNDLCREFTFTTWRSGEVNGLAFWFDAELTTAVCLSSNPRTSTHWLQCFTPFDQPVSVTRGEEVRVSIEMRLKRTKNQPFVFNISPRK